MTNHREGSFEIMTEMHYHFIPESIGDTLPGSSGSGLNLDYGTMV
jgi:hypothetical protein